MFVYLIFKRVLVYLYRVKNVLYRLNRTVRTPVSLESVTFLVRRTFSYIVLRVLSHPPIDDSAAVTTEVRRRYPVAEM